MLLRLVLLVGYCFILPYVTTIAQHKNKCTDELAEAIWYTFTKLSTIDSQYVSVLSNQPYTENYLEIPPDDKLKVRNIIDSVRSNNMRLLYAEGYRIVVYSGNSKELANLAKERVYYLCDNTDVYLIFKSPLYIVKLGDFKSRLEAKQFHFKYLQKEFPKATLVQELVNIRKK